MGRAHRAGVSGTFLPWHGPSLALSLREALGRGVPDWVTQGTELGETLSTDECRRPRQGFSHMCVGQASLARRRSALPGAGMTVESQAGSSRRPAIISLVGDGHSQFQQEPRAVAGPPRLAQPWQVQRPRTTPAGHESWHS